MTKKIFAVMACAFVLTACETTGGAKDGTGATSGGTTGTETYGLDGQPGTETFALGDCEPNCDYPAEALDNPDSLLANRLIHFDFDSDGIKDEYNDILIAHGKYLASNPGVKVRLEGHTDERGTREYNLALSEKRAQSVRRFLMIYGARSESIGVYGFGEELPLALGNNESAWAENRRVELVYDKNN